MSTKVTHSFVIKGFLNVGKAVGLGIFFIMIY